jgi:uncharacterized oligopeptide transporter (OPT) family protein
MAQITKTTAAAHTMIDALRERITELEIQNAVKSLEAKTPASRRSKTDIDPKVAVSTLSGALTTIVLAGLDLLQDGTLQAESPALAAALVTVVMAIGGYFTRNH